MNLKLPKELHDRRDLDSKIGKTKKCTIKGCKKTAIRSVSENKWKDYIEKAGFSFIENRAKKVYICRDHYKEVKKVKQKEEKFSQKKGFLNDALPYRRMGF